MQMVAIAHNICVCLIRMNVPIPQLPSSHDVASIEQRPLTFGVMNIFFIEVYDLSIQYSFFQSPRSKILTILHSYNMRK